MTPEVLGLVKRPRDMGDHYVGVNEGRNPLSRAFEVISMGAPCSKIAFTSRNFPAFPVTNTTPKIGFLSLGGGDLVPSLCIFTRMSRKEGRGRQLP